MTSPNTSPARLEDHQGDTMRNNPSNYPTQPPGPDEEGLRRFFAGPDTALLADLKTDNERLRARLVAAGIDVDGCAP